MSSFEVRLFPKAESDLFEIWHYIAVIKNNPRNADRFIYKMNLQFNKLAITPNLGIAKDEYVKGVFQFPFQNFLIFYKKEESGIAIIRILYGRRNIPKLF